MAIRSAAFGKGSGRSSTPSTTAKIVSAAPTHNASVATVPPAKRGDFRSERPA